MKIKYPVDNLQFLAGGGEMGELTRLKDWSKTSLGKPDFWPQSLRTTLNLLLKSKFPMFLWWGPELICFYNDAYRPSLGQNGKHPSILGMKAKEAWVEIWDIIKPLIDQVLSGGDSTWSEDQLIPIFRNGKIENVYWTFSYSPVIDESGKPTGVFIACIETTDKVITYKKLEESKNELEFAIEATQLGTFDYNPHTNKFSANDRLKKWFGLPADEQIELHHAVNVIAEKDRQRVTAEIQKTIDFSSGGHYDIEYTIVHPFTKQETIAHAKGKAWFNEEKIAYRFNGTLEDVTEEVLSRRRTEAALDELKLFKFMADNASDAFILIREDGSFAYLNNKAIEKWGYTRDEVKQIKVPDVDAIYNAELFDKVFKIAQGEKIQPFETLHKNKEGLIYPVEVNMGSLSLNNTPYLFAVARDIGERVESRNALRESKEQFQAAINATQGILWTNNAKGQMEGEQPGWAALTGQRYEEYQGYGWANAVHPAEAQKTIDVWNEAVKERKTFIYEHRVRMKNNAWGIFAIRAIPLLNNDGSIREWVGVHTDITERKKAEEKVRESEERFRTMAEGTEVLIAVGDETGNATYFNKAWVDLIGRPIEDLLKFGWVDLVHPDDREDYVNHYLMAFEKRQPFTGEFRVLNKNGDYSWLLATGAPRFRPDGSFAGYISSSIDITERKKAEEALKESIEKQIIALKKIEENEEKLNLVIDASDLGTYELNLKTDELHCSEKFHQIFGYVNGEKLSHIEFLNHLHPDDVSIRNLAFKKALDKGNLHYQTRIIWKDKSIHWIEVKGKIFYDEEYNPSFSIGTCADISDEKKHQQVIEDSEQKLNLIIDASELGTWEINLKTKEVTYSERFLEIIGYKKSNKLSLDETVKLIHPDDFQLREEAFKKAFESGILYFTGRILWEDNSVHWVESRGKVFYDEQKTPVTIIGTIADITEQKRQQQTLSDSERKFRLLADSMPQHIWTSDTEGNLNYFNQSVFDYSGLSLEQINKDGWIQIVHPDDREENIKQWLNSITTGKDFLFEHRFLRNDGVYRWQLSRAIPQKDENGKIQMWVGTSTDVQEQKKFAYELERQVLERTKELEQKNIDLEIMNKELESFAYISSHDLQEPLRKIQIFSSRILEKEHQNLSDNGKDGFRRMQAAALRMQTLIDDLLTYSRTNTAERKYENTDLKKIVEEVKTDLKEELQQKSATIEIFESCDLNIIPFQFRQLLHNLISNSLKFSNPDRALHIKIKSEMANGAKLKNDKLSDNTIYCHISISDNGIGFEQQYSEKIFELFQRLHDKTQYNGTGIGLAIVKKIIENHNGIITAKGEVYKGATFDIYIPSN